MRKATYWAILVFLWLVALGLLYVGVIFVVLGPMFGPRGDIDFIDFSPEKKHAAIVEAVLTQAFGLVPILLAVCLLFFSKRIAGKIVCLTSQKRADA